MVSTTALSMDNFIRYTWGVRHEPAGSYVIERENDRPGTVVFGPMPAGMVTAFLAERQKQAGSIILKEMNRGLE